MSLSKPLTFWRGTALLLNIVIGAGLLILPGLAIKRAGDLAFAAWVISALLALPLLSVFILMGRRYPDAGGVAHFAARAFGRRAYIVASFLMLGAVIFGLPSIALTGGFYLTYFIPLPVHLLAFLLVIAASLVHLTNAQQAAKINTLIASIILFALIFFLIIGWIGLSSHTERSIISFPGVEDYWLLGAPFTMLFFAFTGWEVGAGLGEEFANPKRDFPLAMIASFVIASLLYLSIAYVAQHLPLENHYETPFIVMIEPILGSYGGKMVAIIGGLIIFANLSGAIWGISRLVFSLSREGILFKTFQETRGGVPVKAMIMTSLALSSIIMLDFLGWIGVEKMLSLAGQNFLLLYGLSAFALFFLAQRKTEKLLAIFVSLLVFALYLNQGIQIFYPLMLIIAGLILGSLPSKLQHK